MPASCNQSECTRKRHADCVDDQSWLYSHTNLSQVLVDLNIYTNENVTRQQRADFRDILCIRLPKDTDGWTYVHMGKKCIRLQRETKGEKKREADIAFMNTTLDTGVVDRGLNFDFFSDNQAAQNAVKVFKFCFLDIDLTGKQLFDRMLQQLRDNGPQLKKVVEEAVAESFDADQHDRREEMIRRIGKMQNEFMVLLDEDAALAANFPPLSVLLAGLLVPANLNVNMVCQLLQIFLVLLPVLSVAAVSEYADWDHPCKPIPGLRLWARTVGVVASLVILARLAQVIRCVMAKADPEHGNITIQMMMCIITIYRGDVKRHVL
ncbi:ANK2 [Symbiodinium sp. CCMP2592]|nr:ANK2 [Symbiodinium sp. CCMP2592]